MDRNPLATLYRSHVDGLVRGYDKALRDAGFDAVLIHSGALKKRTEFDDQYWPLRPTPHVQHWLPLAEAECALLVVPGKRPCLYRPMADSYWERPAPFEAAYTLESFDVASFPEGREPSSVVAKAGRVAFVGESAEAAARWGIAHDARNPPALAVALDACRTRKSLYEVACLAEANRIAAVGHAAVLERFRAGPASELELHLAFLAATQQDDPDTPYKNIVAKGENAAILHHIAYGRRRDEGADVSLLVDAGACFQGYCSDITRTWVRGSSPAASAFRGLVEGVEALQQTLCGAVRLASPYESLHDECHHLVGELLGAVGITRLSADEAVAAGITRKFLPHGLGHSLGLQTHDVGCALVKPRAENPSLRNTAPIERDQAFTIEPGVYFIDTLLDELRGGPHAGGIDWKLVEALAPFGGVRIEDDLVVRTDDDGPRNLTREHLPVGGGAV